VGSTGQQDEAGRKWRWFVIITCGGGGMNTVVSARFKGYNAVEVEWPSRRASGHPSGVITSNDGASGSPEWPGHYGWVCSGAAAGCEGESGVWQRYAARDEVNWSARCLE
jgi:hypothetical protein